MCGRYAANRDTGTLTEVFKLKNLPSQLLTENYNISPTSKTYAITVDKNQNRTLEIMTWGLIPSWAKDNSMSAKMINARFETVDEKPSFRSAFSKRRCIIPMDGYYEWFRPEDPKEKKLKRIAEIEAKLNAPSLKLTESKGLGLYGQLKAGASTLGLAERKELEAELKRLKSEVA